MHKILRQMFILSLLLIPLSNYAKAEQFKDVYTGCLKDTEKRKAQRSCTQRCIGTYKEYVGNTSKVESAPHPHCESPNFSCLCTYESNDIEQPGKNPR